MTKHDVLEIIRKSTIEVLPGVSPVAVRPGIQLKDLGANSVDRVEIVTLSMEALGVTIPLVDLAGVSDVGGLVDALYARLRAGGA